MCIVSLVNEPTIYCRYVNDCFLVSESNNQLDRLIVTFRSNSVLDFTSVESLNSNFHFLKVALVQLNGTCTTYVFKKDTNSGIYFLTASKWPEKYKDSTVRSMMHNPYTICSELNFDSSLFSLKQVFV